MLFEVPTLAKLIVVPVANVKEPSTWKTNIHDTSFKKSYERVPLTVTEPVVW